MASQADYRQSLLDAGGELADFGVLDHFTFEVSAEAGVNRFGGRGAVGDHLHLLVHVDLLDGLPVGLGEEGAGGLVARPVVGQSVRGDGLERFQVGGPDRLGVLFDLFS